MDNLSDHDIQWIIAGLTRGLKGDIIDTLQSDDSFLNAIRGREGPVGPPGNASFGGNNVKAREIGYFWPDCPVTEGQPEGPTVIATNGDVIYRSHSRFFARLDDVAFTYEYDKVKVQLVQCLRGLAQDWYANELDDVDRQGIRDDSSNTFRVFKARCAARFAKTSLEANRLLADTKFGVQDIRSGVRLATYAHKKMLYAEEAGYISPNDPGYSKKKLDFIYNDLDPALRMYVEAPTSRDTVRDYIAKLSAKETALIDYYSSRSGNRKIERASTSGFGSGSSEQRYTPSTGQANQNRFMKQLSGVAGGGQKAPPSKPCPAHLRETGEAKYHWMQQCDLPSVVAGRKQQSKQNATVKAYLGDTAIAVEDMLSPDFLQAYYGMGQSTHTEVNMSNPYDDVYPDAYHVESSVEIDDERFESIDTSSNSNHSACVASHHADNEVFPSLSCHKCSQVFESRNKLHLHLKESGHGVAEGEVSVSSLVPSNFVYSKASPSDGRGVNFRAYKYMDVDVWNPAVTMKSTACLDTGCGMSAIDIQFLKRFAPELKIGVSPEPITIKGIGATTHVSREYVVFALKLPSVDNNKCAVLAPREFHLVSHLGCNILVGTDVLKPEKFIMDLGKSHVLLPQCDNLMISCRVSPLARPSERRVVTSCKATVIPAFSVKGVEVHVGRGKKSGGLTGDYEFRFGLNPGSAHISLYGDMPSCLIGPDTKHIPFVNFSDRDLRLDKGLRLGEATKVVDTHFTEINCSEGFFGFGSLQWWLAPEFDVKDVDSNSAKIRFPVEDLDP